MRAWRGTAASGLCVSQVACPGQAAGQGQGGRRVLPQATERRTGPPPSLQRNPCCAVSWLLEEEVLKCPF